MSVINTTIIENKILECILKKIEDLQRYTLEWDNISIHPLGDLLKREDVIKLLTKEIKDRS
jgi:hypothetical protein